MGKLNVTLLRYMTPEEMRVLTAIEIGMKDHELVPDRLAAMLANLRHGGVHKLLEKLCKQKLICYERGKFYDGYRLTNSGYDFLALRALASRNVIKDFGNQIGTGKESNIYVVTDCDKNFYCLKLHRLGRICFRKIVEKRDYHKNRKFTSWMHLSRISATKEFAYMKALYGRGLPVPRPVDFNRHCVVMELVSGRPLSQVYEVENVEELYDDLMNLIVRFGNLGIIHGDFNEFNIILTDEGKPVVIDFPQIISTLHPDAELYFERDVQCIKDFFRRRFAYESSLCPSFKDVMREDTLDAEISASGFRKKMQLKLMEEIEDSEEGEEEDRTEGEEEECEEEKELEEEYYSCEESQETQLERPPSPPMDLGEERIRTISISGDSDREIGYSASVRSYSTASTIAPEVIRNKVRRAMVQKQKVEERRRAVAKGEASARTRSRRENRDVIKDYGGFLDWE